MTRARHRRASLAALAQKARKDDARHEGWQRELRELDEAIARGTGAMTDDERRALADRCDRPLD